MCVCVCVLLVERLHPWLTGKDGAAELYVSGSPRRGTAFLGVCMCSPYRFASVHARAHVCRCWICVLTAKKPQQHWRGSSCRFQSKCSPSGSYFCDTISHISKLLTHSLQDNVLLLQDLTSILDSTGIPLSRKNANVFRCYCCRGFHASFSVSSRILSTLHWLFAGCLIREIKRALMVKALKTLLWQVWGSFPPPFPPLDLLVTCLVSWDGFSPCYVPSLRTCT